MKAVYISKYGHAEQLTLGSIAQPTITSNQVLIKVHGAGVNPVDWMVREGYLQDVTNHQLPLVLGWDAAGEVVQVGADVENLTVGDSVFVYAPIAEQGAYAEYIAVDSTIVAFKPKTLDTLTAAAVPLAGTTAWQSIMQGCELKAGDKVLIHNAAGGVGSFAVQIAKACGAYVIGTASGAKKDYVKNLGVDEFIDYQTQRFEDVVNDVDAVLAAIGGDDILTRSLNVIRKGGYLVSLLDELTEFDTEIVEQKEVNFTHWWVTPNSADLNSIAQLIDDGKIKVNINSIFPLKDAAKAHALSESTRTQGKIVLNAQA